MSSYKTGVSSIWVESRTSTNNMTVSFKKGDRVFIIANNLSVKELEVMKTQEEYCTLRELDRYGAIRLRKNRLFKSFEEAKTALNNMRKKTGIECRDTYRSPHDL